MDLRPVSAVTEESNHDYTRAGSDSGHPGRSPGLGMVSMENKRRENDVWAAREKWITVRRERGTS